MAISFSSSFESIHKGYSANRNEIVGMKASEAEASMYIRESILYSFPFPKLLFHIISFPFISFIDCSGTVLNKMRGREN